MLAALRELSHYLIGNGQVLARRNAPMTKTVCRLALVAGLIAGPLAPTDALAGCTYHFNINNLSHETFKATSLRNCKSGENQCKSKNFSKEIPTGATRSYSEVIQRKTNTSVQIWIA